VRAGPISQVTNVLGLEGEDQEAENWGNLQVFHKEGGEHMKKVLLFTLVAGLTASTANAATLWMSFPGSGGDPGQAVKEWTLATSETVDIEIYLTMVAGDNFTGGFHSNEPVALGPPRVPALLDQTAVGTPLAGWSSAASVAGLLGALGTQVNVADNTPLVPEIVGPGGVLWATQTIHQVDPTLHGEEKGNVDYEITFDHATVGLGYLKGGNAVNYIHSTLWAGYSGYYTYGAGSPGGTKIAPRDPLILHHIPEPASLALLALGGLAALRRRS
jgi:hypothetical protein